jgi:hypothetical protein
MGKEPPVASEDRLRSSEQDEASSTRTAGERTVTVGLVPAPDIPEKIARELASELPELLGRRVDDSVSWDVMVYVDPLTGTNLDAPGILDVCHERLRQEGWDLAVCLTDLPVYRAEHLVVADASASRRVGALSLPALGARRLRPKVEEITLRLVEGLYERVRDVKPDDALRTDGRDGRSGDAGTGLLEPFRPVEPPDEDMRETDVDARFIAPGLRGRLRLLAGMVLANRPWKLFPSFKSTIAAAFATAAYVLVVPTIWMLADAVGSARLLLLTAAAIAAMVAWIIVAHHLWERPESSEQRLWTRLYNGVTVLTISVAVLLAYAVLFVLVLLAAVVFVPGGYFQTTLRHPVGLADYLTLTWMATSLATVAGALGSSLEHEDTVRAATYGYRQRRRNEAMSSDEDSEEDSATA